MTAQQEQGEELECNQIKFTGHAVQKMFTRSIKKEEGLSVVRSGEIIAEYPDDYPLPSYLILGFFGGGPLHVVFSINQKDLTCYVITVYQPDPIFGRQTLPKEMVYENIGGRRRRPGTRPGLEDRPESESI
jgi:hypothetical protein